MITGKQRSKLKTIANGLNATASIGKSGVTDNVIKAIDDYLAANEIIKVSIQEGAELDPKVVCNDLAEKLNAEFVQAIGRKFVLYRRARAKDKRKIVL